MALHGSSFEGLKGIESLLGVVIASDQMLSLALPLLARLGVTVDDEYLDKLTLAADTPASRPLDP